MSEQKVHPSFIWDSTKEGYYVCDSDECMPMYLMENSIWTPRWDFRTIWNSYLKAVKAYREWEEKEKEKNANNL